MIGAIWASMVALAAKTGRAAEINCTNDTFSYTNNKTLIDSYVSEGGSVPCIKYKNTTSTTKTLDMAANLTIRCDSATGCSGPAVVIEDGSGTANIRDLRISGLFAIGIDATAETNNTLNITRNEISNPMCVGIVSSENIEDNAIDGPSNTLNCGSTVKSAVQFTPDSATSVVRHNRIDCDTCFGIRFNGTHTGAGNPVVDHNLVNVDVSSGSWKAFNDVSSGGKVNLHDNVFGAKNDTSPSSSLVPIGIGSSSVVYSDNLCDSTIVSLMEANDSSHADLCDNAAPFTLP